MNKTIQMSRMSAFLAISALAAHGTGLASVRLPDCRLDEKGRSECFQPFSEGLAAVLVPVTGQRDGRWGFIDTRGNMVIKPGYDQVRPFRNGLAAAQRKGKWGYIDASGHWAIEPLYDQASNFGSEGNALVTQAGELFRINRTGQTQSLVSGNQRAVLHAPLDHAAQRWSVSLEPRAQLWDLQQGRIMPLPEGLSTIAPPQDGLVPAEKKLPSGAEYWGLLNLQGGWAMSPRLLQSTEQPVHDQGLVARRSKNRWQFVSLQGETQHSGTLHEVHLVRPGSWVVTPEEGQLELWDTKARRVMVLPPGLSLYSPVKLGDSVVLEARDHIALVAAHGQAWHWSLKGRQAHTAQNLLWLLRDAQTEPGTPAGPNEIIRPDGQPFLDAATSARLGDYLITPMNPENARYREPGAIPLALALLEPLDKASPPALLTRDGQIVSQPEWLHMRPRQDSADPWVVQTRDGLFGAIDGHGRWRVPPIWKGLDDFNHGVAMGRRADLDNGQRRLLLDGDGHLLNSPPAISQDCTRWIGAVLACVDEQSPSLQHYLWHPLRQQRSDIAPIRQLARLPYGLYSIQQGKQWGVMDDQGTWRVPPRLGDEQDLRLLDHNVGLETVRDSNGPIVRRYRLISLADGHPLTGLHLQEPETMGVGRYLVHTEHEGSRLINAKGETLLQLPWPSGHTHTDGQWATVLIDDIWGAMDLQGQWHVPTRYRYLSGPLGQHQWLAARTQARIELLVDAEGLAMEGDPAALEEQAAPAGPLPTLRLVQRGQRQAFVNASGQAVINAEVQCSQLVLRNAQGRQTWPLPATACADTKQVGSRP